MTFEIYRAPDGLWHWRLVAGNGWNLALSARGYAEVVGAQAAVRLVQEQAFATPIGVQPRRKRSTLTTPVSG